MKIVYSHYSVHFIYGEYEVLYFTQNILYPFCMNAEEQTEAQLGWMPFT